MGTKGIFSGSQDQKKEKNVEVIHPKAPKKKREERKKQHQEGEFSESTNKGNFFLVHRVARKKKNVEVSDPKAQKKNE